MLSLQGRLASSVAAAKSSLPTCSNCLVSQASCIYALPRKRGPKPRRWQEHDGREPRRRSISPASSSSSTGANDRSPAQVVPGSHEEDPQAREFPPSVRTSPLCSGVIAVGSNLLFETPAGQIESAVAIHLRLLSGLATAVPSVSGADIANRCIHLYVRYVFGAFPLCHEATLRASVGRFFIPLLDARDHAESRGPVTLCFAADSERERIGALRRLTLLTALCASVAYIVPETLMAEKHVVAPLFLRASRETFKIFEDYDLEYPDSCSLGIRHFFSSAIQSATGMYGAASHMLNQAGLVAMKMRLYDESSLEGLDPIEEKLLRNTFWQLYVCDQTALIMKGRPVTIHESLFETEFTLKAQSRCSVPLLIHPECSQGARLEDFLAEGFHIICRLWTMAAHVIHSMETLSKKRTLDDFLGAENRHEAVARLSHAYFEVITLTVDYSDSAELPEKSSPSIGWEADQHLLDMVQRQRTSCLISLHIIKVQVLHSAVRCGMPDVLGVSSEPLSLVMKQIEAAQDFLYVLESVPFIHLQTEGEHCSEKIRKVGSILLEIAEGATMDVIKTRASQCTMRLVNLLARLDSKASDVLEQDMNF
ncbi:C6 transcription factor [Colletotrichum musicola]|uniref:C6 transcription factor n=1 Tax=Colletotrichum musicola TaxID=2175873 RepID=A0A8H6N884_9PEZI|nr:C6 transcription factor [Colletotrichum musicola]